MLQPWTQTWEHLYRHSALPHMHKQPLLFRGDKAWGSGVFRPALSIEDLAGGLSTPSLEREAQV